MRLSGGCQPPKPRDGIGGKERTFRGMISMKRTTGGLNSSGRSPLKQSERSTWANACQYVTFRTQSVTSIVDCSQRQQPNNGMHPTHRHEASHVRCAGAWVMPGVRPLEFLVEANMMLSSLTG